MLDVVAAQENELALAVQVVNVDDAQSRLAASPAILARQHEPSARKLAQNHAKQCDQNEDDREGNDVLGRP
jgi:hypothetical protein